VRAGNAADALCLVFYGAHARAAASISPTGPIDFGRLCQLLSINRKKELDA